MSHSQCGVCFSVESARESAGKKGVYEKEIGKCQCGEKRELEKGRGRKVIRPREKKCVRRVS